MMAAITIYRTRFCPYCVMAARLLRSKGLQVKEIYLDGQPEERSALSERTEWTTVPQIFIGARFIGGYTELAALAKSGELPQLLESV